jgi:hypothetical protein
MKAHADPVAKEFLAGHELKEREDQSISGEL